VRTDFFHDLPPERLDLLNDGKWEEMEKRVKRKYAKPATDHPRQIKGRLKPTSEPLPLDETAPTTSARGQKVQPQTPLLKRVNKAISGLCQVRNSLAIHSTFARFNREELPARGVGEA
jgi:hypothetical protein